MADLQLNSNHLNEKNVTSLKIHIELKALDGCFERICSCTLVIKLPPPALVDLQFSSKHLSETHVTSLKIQIELKAVVECFERICSCTFVMTRSPLLS